MLHLTEHKNGTTEINLTTDFRSLIRKILAVFHAITHKSLWNALESITRNFCLWAVFPTGNFPAYAYGTKTKYNSKLTAGQPICSQIRYHNIPHVRKWPLYNSSMFCRLILLPGILNNPPINTCISIQYSVFIHPYRMEDPILQSKRPVIWIISTTTVTWLQM